MQVHFIGKAYMEVGPYYHNWLPSNEYYIPLLF